MKLYCGDCTKVMVNNIADESIDLTVTSPPYDNLRSYNGYTFVFELIAKQLYRVTKPGGVVVWVVGDSTVKGSETGSSFRQALFFKELGFRLHDTMIYMKAGPAYPSSNRYYQVFEYMFVLSKGKPATVNLIKDRENRWWGQKWSKIRTRRQKDGELKTQKWHKDEGNKEGVRFNIWQYQVGHGYHGDEYAHKHPASFPEALAEDHILSWSNEGDTVLDPMMGSGTTGKMAIKNKRDFIGIDISPEYFGLSKRRIDSERILIRYL